MSDIEPYVPIAKLAEHLHIKVSTVRNWVKYGYIPRSAYIKIGNTYRFHLQDTVKALRIRDKEDSSMGVTVPPPADVDPNAPIQLEFDFNSTQDQ
jgi:hypothetical protein